MRDALRLFRIQLRDMSGWNRAFYCADREKRTGKVALLLLIYLGILACLPAAGMYAYLLVSGLQAVGQLSTFHEVIISSVTMLTLFMALLKANGTLVGFKDYDLLSSLPISKNSFAASRMLLMYAYDMLAMLIVLVPSCAVYAYIAKPEAVFYVLWLLTLPFLALVPMCVGGAIGLLIARVSTAMRGKQYVSMLLLLFLSFGIMWLSMGGESVMQGRVVSAGQSLGGVMRYYPLVGLYTTAMNEGSIPAAVGFIALSLLFATACLLLYARYLKRLQALLSSAPKRKRLKSVAVESSGIIKALYRKEFKRYTASAIYVLNTGFGILLLLIGSVALLIKGTDLVGMLMDIPQAENLIAPGSALMIGFMIATINTTGSSISLEGKPVWILKTLPVPGWKALAAKAMVCLTLAIPSALVGSTACVLTFRPGVAVAVWIYLYTLGLAFFIAMFGLWFNLRSYRFDWPNETVIVKQSMSAGVPMLIAIAINGIGALLLINGASFVPMWALLLACYLVSGLLAASLYRGADKRILALKT